MGYRPDIGELNRLRGGNDIGYGAGTAIYQYLSSNRLIAAV
jgi:hypothetical protein